ncbi:MAG: D-glycerate dehydrogenase [Myxococcota bacterium]
MPQNRPRAFISGALPGRALAGGSVLDPLREVADCHVWEGQGSLGEGALRVALHESEGLLCLLTDRVDRALIEACPRLRVISSCSVGVDHIDLGAASERGIVVGNTPGVLTDATADLAFGLLLAAARRLVEGDRFVREGHWRAERRWYPSMFLGADLSGKTLGVLGLGPIGRAVARRAAGFGMRVVGWTRSMREVEGVETLALPEVLAQSDFVSVHVALAEETRGLIGEKAIAAMKPTAILINTARGGIVDEAALAEALASGALFAAALDVFADEPLAPESPLRDLPNVVLAPHMGSATHRTREAMARMAVENLRAGLLGEPLAACVNPEVIQRS